MELRLNRLIAAVALIGGLAVPAAAQLACTPVVVAISRSIASRMFENPSRTYDDPKGGSVRPASLASSGSGRSLATGWSRRASFGVSTQ